MHDSQENERLRLVALRSYDVLDTPAEAPYDRVTRLACNIFEAPIALVSLVDEDRQWFKSHPGVDVCQTPREGSFCNHAIDQDEPLIVPDALADARFRDLPLVVGPPYIRSYFGASLRNAEGHKLGTLCVIDTRPRDMNPRQVRILQDLAEIVMADLELRRLATTDPLTGALSRRGFFTIAASNIAAARRHGRELSCILLDIDHFKSINDTYGHATGDRALQELAMVLRAERRGEDCLGRIGGEEFAIVLPEAGRAAVLKIGERLRRRIMNTPIPTPDGDINLTISIGVSTLNGEDTGIEDLLNRADVALYAAKAAGRNRLVFEEHAPPLVTAL